MIRGRYEELWSRDSYGRLAVEEEAVRGMGRRWRSRIRTRAVQGGQNG